SLRVFYTNSNYHPNSGQWVEAEGLLGAGSFAPFLDQADVRVLGSAPMPQPRVASAAGLASGEQFGQWVQVEGVVRDLLKDPAQAVVFVSSEGVRFHAVIQPFDGQTLPTEWLDACVALRGVCWTELNAENQPIGFTLFVPGTNHLTFLSPGSKDPFNQPTLP